MNASDIVAKCLVLEGANYVFTVPGATTMELQDALYRNPGTEVIVARHEQGAVYMAEGYARGTRQFGVCMGSRGGAAANMAIGIHNAMQESSPVVMINGQVNSGFQQREAFEEADLMALFHSITKWCTEIHQPNRIPELLLRAIRTARSGRPGPVVVSIPVDLQSKMVEAEIQQSQLPLPPGPDEHGVLAALDLLDKAERPIILAGGGILWSRATKALQDCAETLHIPVLATWLRNDVFPNDHPLYAGSVGVGSSHGVQETVRQADAILAVGVRFSEFSTDNYRTMWGVPIVHIDIEPTQIGKIYPVEVGIVSDASLALSSMARLAKHELASNRSAESRRKWASLARRRFVEHSLEPQEEGGRKLLTPLGVIRGMQQVLHPSTALTFDSGAFTHWFSRFYCWTEPNTLFGTAGGAMGFGFPAGLGVKLADPDRQVVSVVGDGGFMMTIQELETAVRHQISTVTLVINNFSYAQIKAKQQIRYPERVKGNDLTNPDFAQLAKLFGAVGYRVERPEELVPVLQQAVTEKERPVVVDILVDPTEVWPPGEVL